VRRPGDQLARPIWWVSANSFNFCDHFFLRKKKTLIEKRKKQFLFFFFFFFLRASLRERLNKIFCLRKLSVSTELITHFSDLKPKGLKKLGYPKKNQKKQTTTIKEYKSRRRQLSAITSRRYIRRMLKKKKDVYLFIFFFPLSLSPAPK
jgi:hypothetical protein